MLPGFSNGCWCIQDWLMSLVMKNKIIVQQVKKSFVAILFKMHCLILKTKSGKLTEAVLQLEYGNSSSK